MDVEPPRAFPGRTGDQRLRTLAQLLDSAVTEVDRLCQCGDFEDSSLLPLIETSYALHRAVVAVDSLKPMVGPHPTLALRMPPHNG